MTKGKNTGAKDAAHHPNAGDEMRTSAQANAAAAEPRPEAPQKIAATVILSTTKDPRSFWFPRSAWEPAGFRRSASDRATQSVAAGAFPRGAWEREQGFAARFTCSA